MVSPSQTLGLDEAVEIPESFIEENVRVGDNNYIYFSKIIYDWSAFFLATPVRLHFDEKRQVYVVKKCSVFQQVAHVLAAVAYSFSAVNSFVQTGRALLQNTESIVLYFDVLNKLAVNSGIYIHMYVHWFRLDRVEAFIDAVQTNAVTKCSKTPKWKCIVPSAFICTLIIHLTCTWVVLIFGMDFATPATLYKSSQMAARELFWWNRNAAVDPSLPLCAVAFFGKLFDSYLVHVPLDAFTLMQLFCIYYIVKDFFKALLEQSLPTDEGLQLVREYKKLMKVANDYLGLYVVQFTMMTVTYHSIHLFDMLNSTTTLWKISTYAYVGFVVTFFFLVTLIFVQTKKLKRWLWKDKNYMKIPMNELKPVLYDLLPFNYKFGIRIGKFFTMTAETSGGLLAQMIAYSMLVKLSD